jgi:hypothetical protein
MALLRNLHVFTDDIELDIHPLLESKSDSVSHQFPTSFLQKKLIIYPQIMLSLIIHESISYSILKH